MHYLIDGYNVINSSDIFSAPTLEGRRNKLFEFIQFNRPHGNIRNSISVVFDCKLKNLYESKGYNKSYIGNIEVIFSDGIASADDVITELIEESQNPYNITIVTNDKGIRRRTAPSGAKYESVEMFLSKGFKQKIVKKRSAKYFESNGNEQIDEELKKLWLKE
ncbi:MAG: NYN domain-containing protein [Endomicrobium sp.]|jgi:predicted RNA-binding protein with PIN domain|nr:NYN domain-containing protein [Endomicrobium sp.]